MKITCHIHGEVDFNGTTDFIGVESEIMTIYCPKCEEESRQKPSGVPITILIDTDEREMLKAFHNPQHQLHFEEYQDEFHSMMSKIISEMIINKFL